MFSGLPRCRRLIPQCQNLYALFAFLSFKEISFITCPGRGAVYCDQFVCLCVCLSMSISVSGSAGPIFTKFCVQIPFGCGSVLLCQCCDTLRTSGFMDDVTFDRSVPYGVAWKAEPLT